jgi:hypothetical protein
MDFWHPVGLLNENVCFLKKQNKQKQNNTTPHAAHHR